MYIQPLPNSKQLDMKKKNYAENSEEDNEFDVDEPEEIQNNASDDDWTPDKDTSGGRRTSSRLRNFPPRARAPIIDPSSTEEEGSDEDGGLKRKIKGKGRGRQPVKKQKVSSTSTPPKQKKNNVSTSVSSDSEPSSTTTTPTNNSGGSPSTTKVSKDFTSGAFIVLKSEVEKESEDPPLWKIDGKALLQKYIPFEQDGKTFYKNTSVYSGWTINNKNNYYPVTVIFKQQTRKEHIVEFNRSQIKKKEQGEKVADNGNDDNEKDENGDCGEKDIKKEASEKGSKKNDISDKQDSCKIARGDTKDEDNDKDEVSKDEDSNDEESNDEEDEQDKD